MKPECPYCDSPLLYYYLDHFNCGTPADKPCIGNRSSYCRIRELKQRNEKLENIIQRAKDWRDAKAKNFLTYTNRAAIENAAVRADEREEDFWHYLDALDKEPGDDG